MNSLLGHYYNSLFFQLDFLMKKYPKVTSVKKNHLVNPDKSFCTCPMQLGNHLVILTCGMIDKMIDYLIGG